jgi:hypothetical protein
VKKFLFILFFASFSVVVAQKDTLPFNKKAEIVYDGKRYRVYNNYLTFGICEAYSDIRKKDQVGVNVDYQFHLQKEYFQAGFFMTGDQLLKNTMISGHACFGIRREKQKYNLAGFIGPSYSRFVTGYTDTSGTTYVTPHEVFGGYICLQAIYKPKFDLGIGAELFADISGEQKMAGARLVLYFSGAYRGEKKSGRFRSKDN